MSAQQATKAVNISLTLRNWAIGYYIAEFELRGANRAAYGDRLAPDLATALRTKNVSNTARRQLYAYLEPYRAYPQIERTATVKSPHFFSLQLTDQKVPTLSALFDVQTEIDPEKLITQLTYSHFQLLVEINDPLKRRFYEVEILCDNLSVRELKRQIDTQYFEHSALSVDKNLASQQTRATAEQQAPQLVIRDPYVFEFLGLKPSEVVNEGDLEDALRNKIQDFLLELRACQQIIYVMNFVKFGAKARQHCIVCYHFYMLLVIKLVVDSLGQPPIGILLCTRKNLERVEYALGACRT